MKRGTLIYFPTKRGFRQYILLSWHEHFKAATCRTPNGNPVIRSVHGAITAAELEAKKAERSRAKLAAKYAAVLGAIAAHGPDYLKVADALNCLPVVAWGKIKCCERHGLLTRQE